jgi:hypothetical protein
VSAGPCTVEARQKETKQEVYAEFLQHPLPIKSNMRIASKRESLVRSRFRIKM